MVYLYVLILGVTLPLWAENVVLDVPSEASPDQAPTPQATFKQVSSILIVNEPSIDMGELTKPRNKAQPRGPQQMRVQVWRSMSMQQPPQGGIQPGNVQTSASELDDDIPGEYLLPDGVLPQVIIPPTMGGGIAPQEEEVGMKALPVGPACMEVSHTGINQVMEPLQVAPSKKQTIDILNK